MDWASDWAELIFPRSLGVGYSVIQQMISGDTAWKLLAGVLIRQKA